MLLMAFFATRNGLREFSKCKACQAVDIPEETEGNAIVIASDRCKRCSKGFRAFLDDRKYYRLDRISA